MEKSVQILQLIVNNRCNCFCQMCDVGVARRGRAFDRNKNDVLTSNFTRNILAKEAGSDSLTIAEYEAFIEKILPKTIVYINAAEPLLFKNIFELLHLLCRKNIKIYLTTNGLLLEKYVEKIACLPIANLCVSLDGPAPIHDSVRGIKGLFAKAFSGMLRLRQLRPDMYIRTSTAISHLNQSHLVALAQALEPLQLQSMLFNHLNFIDEDMARIHNQYYSHLAVTTSSSVSMTPPGRIHLAKLSRELLLLRHHYPMASIYPNVSSPEDLFLYYRAPFSGACGKGCTVGSRSLAIAPNGDIQLGQRCFSKILGNIRTHELEDALHNNEWLNDFRKAMKDAGGYFPACTRCCGGFNGGMEAKAFPWAGSKEQSV